MILVDESISHFLPFEHFAKSSYNFVTKQTAIDTLKNKDSIYLCNLRDAIELSNMFPDSMFFGPDGDLEDNENIFDLNYFLKNANIIENKFNSLDSKNINNFVDIKCLDSSNLFKRYDRLFFEIKELSISSSDLPNFIKNINVVLKRENINFKIQEFSKKILPKFLVNKVKIDGQSYYLNFNGDEHYLSLVLPSLIDYTKRMKLSLGHENDFDTDLWKKLYSAIEHPIVLVSEENDIVFQNKVFIESDLLLHKSKKMKSGDQVTSGENTYVLVESVFSHNNKNYKLKVFINNSDLLIGGTPVGLNVGNTELGIIASSMAHEINNPLAGILAGLSVLELYDENDNTIEEMKKSASRCKDLVELFLGFSKFDRGQELFDDAIQTSFDQALNLARYRMIEQNCILDFKYYKFSKNGPIVNPSIVSMVFYLLLNDFMTTFGHYQLITSTETKKISGKVIEEHSSFYIEVENKELVHKDLFNSKLLIHLLSLSKLNVEIIGNKILFSSTSGEEIDE